MANQFVYPVDDNIESTQWDVVGGGTDCLRDNNVSSYGEWDGDIGEPYTDWIEFDLGDAYDSDAVKFYVSDDTNLNSTVRVEYWAQGGSNWNYVFDGSVPTGGGTWVTKTFEEDTVTKFRFRFEAEASVYQGLHEFLYQTDISNPPKVHHYKTMQNA